MSPLWRENKLPKGTQDIIVSKITGNWIAAFTPEYKLIFTKSQGVSKPVLFDLTKDPHELTDFYGQSGYEKATKEMASFLLDYIERENDSFAKDGFMIKSIKSVIENN
ncbi:MAG: hypothetical protein SNH41_00100 [Rikenellaceae bacterium]